MNPKQLEWLAMERAVDLRREAAADRVVVAARSSAPVPDGLLPRLAAGRVRLGMAVRTILTAVHLIGPRGRAVL